MGHLFPAVCIRTGAERLEALDKECFVLAGIDENSPLRTVELNRSGWSYAAVVDKMVWRSSLM